jgi:hypothetical protein
MKRAAGNGGLFFTGVGVGVGEEENGRMGEEEYGRMGEAVTVGDTDTMLSVQGSEQRTPNAD